jgi:hypothetical protein
LNNRDWAAAIWLSVFVISLLLSKSIRGGLFAVLKELKSRVILIPLFSLLLYYVGMIYMLYLVGYWQETMLKDTIVWISSVGVLAFFSSTKSLKEEKPILTFVKDNIKVIIFLEFFLNVFVFPIGIELILVPIVTLLVLMQIVAKDVAKNQHVFKFVSSTISVFGYATIVFCAYQLYKNWQTFFVMDNLIAFSFPVLLSVLFIPYLYLLILYVHYEDVLVRIKVIFYDNPEKLKQFEKAVIHSARLSLKRLKELRQVVRVHRSMTLEEFKKMIA